MDSNEGSTPQQAEASEAATSGLNIHTYDYVWLAISFLISLLWFRINLIPFFPVGLLGGLVISYMVHRIDRSLGKPSYLLLAVPLCVIACLIGVFLNG